MDIKLPPAARNPFEKGFLDLPKLLTIPKHIIYLFFTYLLGILLFTLFRVILLAVEYKHLGDIPGPERLTILLKAFFMGFRFDTVISGYILFIPLLVLSITSSLRIDNKIIYRFIFVYLYISYLFAFLICGIDIPYFNHYFSHLTVVVLTWLDDAGFILKMIFQDFRLWWGLIPFIIFAVAYYLAAKKIAHKTLIEKPLPASKSKTAYLAVNIGLSLAAVVVLFIGVRGRVGEKSPIKIGTAYFCDYAFANQLGLNPVYTFFHSYINSLQAENKSIHLMDSQKAIDNVRKYLNIPGDTQQQSPIARNITPDQPALNANVVLIIMEGLSAAHMKRYGNPDNLTPFLDRIADRGYCFDNVYTSGIHTFNGIYAALFSYPAIRKQHPLKTVSMKKNSGMAAELRKHGYATVYFTTHDAQFDNIGGFLRANDFERIVSLADYPGDKRRSTLGVPDDFMFDFSMPILDELAQREKPFLAVMMTGSNHRPFIVPRYFKPRGKEEEKQIVEYSDWALQKFIRMASRRGWFKRTLFVFISDHGLAINAVYDMPLNLNHTPFIIFSPRLIKEGRRFTCLGGQIDVFPTIMGLLKYPYVNNTLGIDLLNEKEKRPYIYFSADDKYGVLDDEYYLIVREERNPGLYKYKTGDPRDYLSRYPQKVEIMKAYAESMFQTMQWLIDNHKD